MSAREVPQKFLVSFSFAGEQRDIVRPIAEALEAQLGRNTVYFDEWYEFYIAGPGGNRRLGEIYSEKSELVVVCVSKEYGEKVWTLAEHEVIGARTMKNRVSTDPRDQHRTLALRVGDGDVAEIPFTTIAPDVRGRPPAQTRDLILNRLRLVRPGINGQPSPPAKERFIYLAECTPDLDDPEKTVNRRAVKTFLEHHGWTVLPEGEYPEDQYGTLLDQDLKRSMAFVQLRGPYAWRRGRFDRVQNDAAAALNVTRFLFRSREINLAKVEPPEHREFLSAPGVVADGFDDFLRHLEKQLALLVAASEASSPGGGGNDSGIRPLVRVVTRSADPDPKWEQVFRWIYKEQNILSELLAPDESFESMHGANPCHGFVLVCDKAALDEGPMSPRNDMRQCRVIQFREKEQERRPPVAVVYWTPPDPSWARLLRVQPDKLYCAAVPPEPVHEIPPELGDFFAEVRRVAQ